jgi:hypothetical protein
VPDLDTEQDRTRRDIEHAHGRAAADASAVGMPLGMWAGNGDYATFSAAARDKAGKHALGLLKEAIAELIDVRDRLAAAIAPTLDQPEQTGMEPK